MNDATLPRRPSSHLSAIAGAAGILVAVACSSPAAAEVVARVGATDVTSDEIRAYLDTLSSDEQSALGKDLALLSQVVRAYLARRALLQEALAKKWEQQPAVKAQLDRVREQALTELYLQSVSKPPDDYPSEAEVQAAYDANRSAFEVPRQYPVARIFVAVARGAAGEAEEKGRRRVAEIAKQLAHKRADFAAIARAGSDEKEAAQRGGEIGWLADGRWDPGQRHQPRQGRGLRSPPPR